jgi:hypothetical protein
MPRASKLSQRRQFKANLPADVWTFLQNESDRFGSSVNSELVRAIRERMERSTAGR